MTMLPELPDAPTPADADDGWCRLGGGTLTVVARRGDVVRRSLEPWSPTVHELLRHLERVGFDAASRLLDVDADHEYLTFVPGDIPSPLELRQGWKPSDGHLADAARLLRRFHDATASFVHGPAHRWNPAFLDADPAADVVCHNDFGPWNCTFVDGRPTGMIDFSEAAPGRREWDLVFTATFFVPLYAYADFSDAPRRLRRFCDAYGLEDRSGVVDVLLARTERTIEVAEGLIVDGGERAALGRDILPFSVSSLDVLRRERPRLEAAMA